MTSPLTEDDEKAFKLRAKLAELIIQDQIIEDCEQYPIVDPSLGGAPITFLDPTHNPPEWFDSTKDSKDSDSAISTQFPLKFKIGIIGAGMAGLYAAIQLHRLIEIIKTILGPRILEIDFEILESSDRRGGRVYTHYFTDKDTTESEAQRKGLYYDAGAMRFPDAPIMARLFRMFRDLGMSKHNPKSDKIPAVGDLIPYYLVGDKTPLLYNNIRLVTNQSTPVPGNAFGFQELVPENFINKGYQQITREIFGPWLDGLMGAPPGSAEFRRIWQQLRDRDARCISTRKEIFDRLRGPDQVYKYSDVDLYHVTDWCETMAGSTGSYDTSFTTSVIHSLPFSYPLAPDSTVEISMPSGKPVKWWCINGGSQLLTDRMVAKYHLESKIERNHKVTKIVFNPKSLPEPLSVTIQRPNGEEIRKYDYLINTTTFGALQTIDTTQAGLNLAHRQAIRGMQYAPAVKVGILFRKRWWADKPHEIKKGGQGKTDRPTRVVVYPSYALDSTGPGVLLACYNSINDATRFGNLVQNTSDSSDPNGDALNKLVYDIVISDLAALHGVEKKVLEDQAMKYHVYSWAGNPNMRGAWGQCGPGQYSSFFTKASRPGAMGHLLFAGEHLSTYPGWIEGAFETANMAIKLLVTHIAQNIWKDMKDGGTAASVQDLLTKLADDPTFGKHEYEPTLDTKTLQWQVYLGIIEMLGKEMVVGGPAT